MKMYNDVLYTCQVWYVACNLFYTIEAKFNYMCHMQLKIIVAKSKFASHDYFFVKVIPC
jgi:hypothetical protein